MTKPDPISPCPRCGSTCYVCRGGGMLGGAGVMLCKGDKVEPGCPCYYQAHNLDFHEQVCAVMKNDKIIARVANTVNMPVEVLMDFIKRMDWRSCPEDKSWYLASPRYAIRAGEGE